MCIYVDDWDGETLFYGWRTARIEHECEECRRIIEPGERYLLQQDALDGTVTQMKMCRHCRGVISLYGRLTGCPQNWYWGSVLSMYEDDSGMIADGLMHDLPAGGRVTLLRAKIGSQRRWRSDDGELVEVPA